ncbi:DUF2189 domain-containing protein [Lysobacter sp. A6]|uniref:DUF2189 domain-containing protein n=1 Tax=Noviluteimonas lactosilytica TaxID=2888523 RepID=A0ABS8JHH9_9GAMM|nr:BPSS1780 family membrane protein [Lysobacter lactosilyticus]MCC8363041.1 DUF2189 domain-containing protein [Lysobacter lactosilyticus]
MEVRKIPVAQGLAWFRAAIDIGARNPKAVFGAATLFIATLYGLAILLGVVAVALTRDGDAAPNPMLFASIFVPLFVGLMVIMPVLIGGLMHVIREAEAGRPVRARDLFAPMRSTRLRTLALLGLVQIAFAILGGVVAVAIAGTDYWQDYFGAVRGAMGGEMPVVPQPRHPGLLMVVQLAYNYFTYAVMLFAVPLVLFSGQGIVEAVRNALRASVRNVGANLVAAGLFVAGTVVAAIVVLLLSMLANVIGSLVHPAVGTLLSMLVLLAFVSALLVVLAGGAYIAWRDTFGGDVPPAPPSFGGIEV